MKCWKLYVYSSSSKFQAVSLVNFNIQVKVYGKYTISRIWEPYKLATLVEGIFVLSDYLLNRELEDLLCCGHALYSNHGNAVRCYAFYYLNLYLSLLRELQIVEYLFVHQFKANIKFFQIPFCSYCYESLSIFLMNH